MSPRPRGRIMEFRIYVASLSDYNEGRIVGDWLDLNGKTKEEVLEEIGEILKQSKCEVAEEWAVHDYELPFDPTEYPDLDKLMKFVEEFSDVSHYEEKVVEAYFQICDCLEDASWEDYEEKKYGGPHESPRDFAYDYLAETEALYRLSPLVEDNIDWDGVVSDLENDFNIVKGSDHNYYVFRKY
jgi:antirestriction protein